MDQDPWFHSKALEVDDIVDIYSCEWLPGNIRLEWTETWLWRQQFMCYDRKLVINRGKSREKVHGEVELMVSNGILRMSSARASQVRVGTRPESSITFIGGIFEDGSPLSRPTNYCTHV